MLLDNPIAANHYCSFLRQNADWVQLKSIQQYVTEIIIIYCIVYIEMFLCFLLYLCLFPCHTNFSCLGEETYGVIWFRTNCWMHFFITLTGCVVFLRWYSIKCVWELRRFLTEWIVSSHAKSELIIFLTVNIKKITWVNLLYLFTNFAESSSLNVVIYL